VPSPPSPQSGVAASRQSAAFFDFISDGGFLPKAATTLAPVNGLPEPDNWLPEL
jgi:hypothetical protein